MIKEITFNGKIIKCDLQYKNVKNINLRIKPDCSISVSANKRVPITAIEDFIASKGDFILKALDKYVNRVEVPIEPKFTDAEIMDIILDMCKKYIHIMKKLV